MAAIAAVYHPIAKHPFTSFDDPQYVSHHPTVAQGLSLETAAWAFRTLDQANWHPLTWLSYLLDVSLFGLAPGPMHVVNVALHALSALLLARLLVIATGRRNTSLFVAAVFALHPLSVEAVAWISQRKDVLSTALLWISLAEYVTWSRTRGKAHYFASLAALGAGLLSKPMLVSAPLLMLLFDYWPLARRESLRRLVIEKLPFFALSLAVAAVTLVAQSHGGSLASGEIVPLSARLANAALSYVSYLGLALWPSGLCFFYPHPWIREPSIDLLRVSAALLALASISAAVIGLRSRAPQLLFGWLWYLGTALPVIGIVQVGRQAMADRYAYLPLVGIGIALSVSASEWIAGSGRLRRLAPCAAVIALAALAILSHRQLGYWSSDEALFRRAIAVTRGNWAAHTSLGTELEIQGRFEEALVEYQAAIAAAPDDVLAHYNVATLYASLGRRSEATAAYERVLALSPRHVNALNNLAVEKIRDGDFARAVELFERSLELRPASKMVRRNLERARALRDAKLGR